MNTKRFLKVTHRYSREDREYIKIALSDLKNTGAKITLDNLGFRILISRGNITKSKKVISKHSKGISNLGMLIRVYDKKFFENQFKETV